MTTPPTNPGEASEEAGYHPDAQSNGRPGDLSQVAGSRKRVATEYEAKSSHQENERKDDRERSRADSVHDRRSDITDPTTPPIPTVTPRAISTSPEAAKEVAPATAMKMIAAREVA